MATFIYDELNPSACLIRLLILDHDTFEKPLHGSLVVVPLEEGIRYQALSYTWGAPQPTGSITLGGQSKSITKSLEVALRHIRQASESITLWVDALCINQDDDVEKTHQVRQMLRVYLNARHVFVWLGESGSNSDLAMDLAQKVNRENIHTLLMDETNSEAWNSLLSLFQRHWWHRIWIIQEYASADSLLFVCGQKWMDFVRFKHACLAIQYYKEDPKSSEGNLPGFLGEPGFNSYLLMEHCRLARRKREELTLISLLGVTRGREATDPRDKVFALLGMATDEIATNVETDYTKSTKLVYASLAKTFIERSKKLSFLRFCQTPKRISGLPSWVADWSIHSQDLPLQDFPHQSTSKLSGAEPPTMEFSMDLESLTVSGIRRDVVKAVGEIMGDEAIEALCNWETLLFQEIQPDSHPYRSQTGLMDAFRRSVLADYVSGHGSPPSPDILEAHSSITSWFLHPEEIPRDPETRRRMRDHQRPFRLALLNASFNRRLIITAKKFVGIAPRTTRPGDGVCVLLGGEVPFVLREDGLHHVLIGECYIHGVMPGQAAAEPGHDGGPMKKFTLR